MSKLQGTNPSVLVRIRSWCLQNSQSQITDMWFNVNKFSLIQLYILCPWSTNIWFTLHVSQDQWLLCLCCYFQEQKYDISLPALAACFLVKYMLNFGCLITTLRKKQTQSRHTCTFICGRSYKSQYLYVRRITSMWQLHFQTNTGELYCQFRHQN